MADTLKRTFHGELMPSKSKTHPKRGRGDGDELTAQLTGCLTCRKRKVRCRGGDPCQNCSRMNITCHSSFDTNLRIRVSTSTGQKDVGARPKPARATNPKPQPVMAVSPSLIDFDSRTKPMAPNFQSHFNTFHLASPSPIFASEPQNIPQFGHVSDVDALHFSGGWGFDFSYPPSVEHGFQIPTDVSMGAPMGIPAIAYSQFRPPTPASQQTYSISDSEGSISSRSQSQSVDGTKEWVPRRRKRPKKAAATLTQPGNTAGSSPDNTSVRSQDNASTTQDSQWTLESWALDFVKKCAPHCPMRQAVLAWKSRESAADVTSTNPEAETWYIQSSDQVDKLMTLSNPTVQLGTLQPVTNAGEIIICTSLFLNRYDILIGDVEAADSRLERITRWLADHPGDLNLSGFASKLLLFASYLQIRLNMFGGSFPRYTFLLDVLVDRPDHHQIVEKSHSFFWEMFGNDFPQKLLAEDLEKIPISLRLHEMFCLLASMLHYRSAQRSQSASQDPAIWEDHLSARYAGIESDLQRAETEFDIASAMNSSGSVLQRGPMGGLAILSSRRFSSTPPEPGDMAAPASPTSNMSSAGELSRIGVYWLTAYASFLTCKIMWSRITQPAIRTDNASASAAETILQIALLLRRSRGYSVLHPSCLVLWPLPLFVAGIETVDEVRSDWVRLFMTGIEVGGMRPGSGNQLLDLMEEVRRRQDQTGTRVYVDQTMAETGRMRGIFAFRG